MLMCTISFNLPKMVYEIKMSSKTYTLGRDFEVLGFDIRICPGKSTLYFVACRCSPLNPKPTVA